MSLHKFNPNDKGFTEEATYLNEELEESYNMSTYAWHPGMVDDDNNMMKLRMTKSTLGTFKMCPRQYYYQYVLRIPQGETIPMVRGTNVHNVVEYFWKQINEDVLEVVKKLLDEDKQITAKKLLEDFLPVPEDGFHYEEGTVIEQWFEWNWLRLLVCYTDKTMNLWQPVGNELEVHAMEDIEVDGVIVPVHYKGYVDRVFSDGQGGFIVMELKTGKWKEKPYKYSGMRFEMEFYRMMLVKSDYSEYLPVTQWAWEYPYGQVNGGDGATWVIEDTKSLSRYASKSIKTMQEKVIRAHLNNDFPPVHTENCKTYCRHTTMPCGYCDYIDICPGWNMIKEMTL